MPGRARFARPPTPARFCAQVTGWSTDKAVPLASADLSSHTFPLYQSIIPLRQKYSLSFRLWELELPVMISFAISQGPAWAQ